MNLKLVKDMRYCFLVQFYSYFCFLKCSDLNFELNLPAGKFSKMFFPSFFSMMRMIVKSLFASNVAKISYVSCFSFCWTQIISPKFDNVALPQSGVSLSPKFCNYQSIILYLGYQSVNSLFYHFIYLSSPFQTYILFWPLLLSQSLCGIDPKTLCFEQMMTLTIPIT